jgi:hypothetical protein
MKRFALKVSAKLHAEVKALGKQQEVLDAALVRFDEESEFIGSKVEIDRSTMLKQVSFVLSDEHQQWLQSKADKPDSRHMLKLIRKILHHHVLGSHRLKLFFSGFDEDLSEILKGRFRDLWTHESTAIEGNTLTLGETSFILKEGLTISGKTVREHDEISGHAKAIEIIYSLLSKSTLTENDLFDLHRAVVINPPFDIDKPVGAWKRIDNGAYWSDQYIMYPPPSSMKKLMALWLELTNSLSVPESHLEAIKIYSVIHNTFVAIHPFFDGNGRIARLLANLPVIKAGFSPIIVSNSVRFEYSSLMKNNKLKNHESMELITPEKEFEDLLYLQWKASLDIIEEVKGIQRQRVKR